MSNEMQKLRGQTLTDAIHYAELGSPTRGKRAVEEAVAQARADALREVIGWMRKNSSESLTKVGIFLVVITTEEFLKQLEKWGIKSGQMTEVKK